MQERVQATDQYEPIDLGEVKIRRTAAPEEAASTDFRQCGQRKLVRRDKNPLRFSLAAPYHAH